MSSFNSPPFKFHFVTLFPETIEVWLSTSIVGRALKAGLFSFQTYQLRDFSETKHRNVDDSAYGGGGGMVLRIEPLVKCVEQILQTVSREKTRIIYFSPAGRLLTQKLVDEFVPSPDLTDLILICGHYEGIDERFVETWVDEQISLGEFVLTGGEIPALAFTDALIRQLDGAIAAGATLTESFRLKDENEKLLVEYPHYTRPPEFRGLSVPEVLLSGDHKRIEKWRLEQAKLRTAKRSDLAGEN